MKKRYASVILVIIMAVFLVSCGNGSNPEVEAESPADLTEYDLKIVDGINAESKLVRNLYENVGENTEPFIVETDGRSEAIAVRIPKADGEVRIKEITLTEDQYNLYGMAVGVSQEEFEREMLKKGYEKYKQIESMGYQSYKNGNVYVAINYDKNSTVERIFVNLLVDYNEWRGVE
ncbi:MAG: hypothetical protein MJ134_11065 [Lachnospiraceae bacterium]|nr:hypothetical protein [Lachnospiraceae bacterium]